MGVHYLGLDREDMNDAVGLFTTNGRSDLPDNGLFYDGEHNDGRIGILTTISTKYCLG